MTLRTITLLTLLALVGCATGPARDEEMARQGRDALAAGNDAQAEALLKEALASNPDNRQALTDLGGIYLKRHQYAEARPLYQRVVDNKAAYEGAAQTPEQRDDVARLQQLANEKLEFIAAEESADAEALSLAPPGSETDPAFQPLPAPGAAASTPAAPATGAQSAASGNTTTIVPAPAPTARGPAYLVQIGAFKSQARAERMSVRLRALPAQAVQNKEILLTQVKGLIKVHVGPYATFKEAQEACEVIKQSSISCFPRKQ